MRNEVQAPIKERAVWETVRRFDGVSVSYGQGSNIYEVLLPNHLQCCIVVTSADKVSAMEKRIAKTISKTCYKVGSIEALTSALTKLSGGVKNGRKKRRN